MEFTAKQIAELLQGDVMGDPEQVVNQLCKIEDGQPKGLSFLANPKYTEHIYSTDASILIVNRTFEAEQPLPDTCTLIRVENAYECFARLLELYDKQRHNRAGIHPTAVIEDDCQLGEDVYIGAHTFIGKGSSIGRGTKIYERVVVKDNCRIGEGSILMPGVIVMHDCKIGNYCTLQPNAVIGGDGFGFAPNSDNQYQKVPQIGNVILEDHVEIGSNTTIDRATMGSTVIRRGVKLDNLIQIAHNVEIGEHTVIAAQTGVAGSTRIGANCMIGGQVGIIGHLHIADRTKIAAQSGVGQDITEESTVLQGSPAFEVGPYKRSYVGFRNLPQIQQELFELKKQVEALKQEKA